MSAPAARHSWSASAGEHPTLLGERLVVLLAGDDARLHAERLRRAGVVDQDLAAVLDELARGGISALPAFVALELTASGSSEYPTVDVRGVVRGAIRIEARAAGGARAEAEDAGSLIWSEVRLAGVECLNILASDAAQTPAVSIGPGTLSADSLHLSVQTLDEETVRAENVDTVDLGLTLAAMAVSAPSVAVHVTAAAASAPPATGFGIVILPDGTGVELGGALLVGRSPRSDRVSEGHVPELIVLDHRDVSRTHARIFADTGRVLLEDLGSTNGTVLHGADGRSHRLRPHEPVVVPDGAVVRFGNGPQVTFRGLP